MAFFSVIYANSVYRCKWTFATWVKRVITTHENEQRHVLYQFGMEAVKALYVHLLELNLFQHDWC